MARHTSHHWCSGWITLGEKELSWAWLSHALGEFACTRGHCEPSPKNGDNPKTPLANCQMSPGSGEKMGAKLFPLCDFYQFREQNFQIFKIV